MTSLPDVGWLSGRILLIGTLIVLSGCAVMSDSEESVGYGPYPDDYRSVIERYLAGEHAGRGYRAVEWTDPEARYERTERGWLYGWRVCAGLRGRGDSADEGAPLGYFLINDGRIIHSAVGRPVPGDFDGLAAADHCPSRLADRVIPTN